MSEVGALSIRITADGGNARRELGSVSDRVKQSGRELRANANRWAKWGIAAGAAATAVAAAMIRSSMKTIDELGKMADQLGIATESLQALRHQAELSGMSTAELDTNLERMSRRLGQAARDGGRTADTIRDLGLSLTDLSNMQADEQLDQLAIALAGVDNHGQRAAIANDLFGRSGGRMLNMLRDMEGGLQPVLTSLEEMGALLSREEVAMVEAANDAITEAGTAINTIWQRAAVEIAPIIQAIAGEIVAMSKDMEGFGNLALDVMDGVAKATGVAADSFQGWRMIVQGSRTAFVWVQRDFVAMLMKMSQMWDGFVNVFKEGINTLIRTANMAADRIPWMDSMQELETQGSETTRNLQKMWNDLNIEFADVMFDMHNLAGEELPSAGIERFMARTKAAAEEAAAAIHKAGSSGPQSPEQDEGPAFMFNEEENEKWLEQLRERYMTEAELQTEAHEGELERLRELKDQELLTEQEYEDERERMARAHADAMAGIQEMERRQRVGIMTGMMDNLSQLMNTGSKKMFAIGKAAAIANALVQGKEAVVSSYAAGARIGGPKLGAAYAVTAAAATAAQISQIRSSSFGGAGGGANTFSGGVPTTRTTDEGGAGSGSPGQTVDINIAGSGNSFSVDQVRELISQINEQSGDGVNIAFNG